MIKKLLSHLRVSQKTPRVYSRVVADDNHQTIVELLRQAAQEANADQKQLARSAK